MNTHTLSQEDFKANYWVISTGLDCDGFNRGYVFSFVNEEEAYAFQNEQNKSSDGLVYYVINKLEVLQEYCQSYDKNWVNYI